MATLPLAIKPRSCTHCRATFRTGFERCPNDGAVLAALGGDALEGATVGPYAIGTRIGEGAMGRIYRARHARLPAREVALKVLFGDVAAIAGMRQRFAHEAEATSRLAHPHIVSVVDFGETAEGLLYLAMELVAGRPLGDLIASGPMPWPRAVAIARQLCSGLVHAHGLEIVHRDLKPDNVLIGDGDHVRIVDFGLALDVDPIADRTRLTSGNMAIGTPAYAAPEQQLGNGVVDGRADQFALGVTLFELVAGRVPFEGTAMELICQNAMADRPTIASRTGIAVPAALEAIVEKLMRPTAEERFADVGEVLAALDALTAPPRPRRWIIAATAVPLIAVGLGILLALPRGAGRAPAPGLATDSVAVVADAPATSPDSPDGGSRIPAARDPPAIASPPPVAPRPAGPPRPMPAHATARPHRNREPTMSPHVETVPERSAEPTMSPHREPLPASTGAMALPLRVELAHMQVRGGVTATTVQAAVARSTGDLQACYRAVARRDSHQAAVTIAVRLGIDTKGHATGVDARGDGLLAACVAAMLGTMQLPEPATGTAMFDVVFQRAPSADAGM